MGKKVRAAAGAVMLSLGMAWVPWIVVGTLAALVLLLVFVHKFAFCKQGDAPTRRVIAIIRAVKAPSSPPGRRNRRRAKPPGQP